MLIELSFIFCFDGSLELLWSRYSKHQDLSLDLNIAINLPDDTYYS